jgi:DNA-binding IclR family transcriptional regulator
MPQVKKRERQSANNDGSHSRLLSILTLFSIEKPSWTAEEAAAELDVSITTAYRYFKSLSQIGLITSLSRGAYMLGPAIIEWDRQIQLCDPMLAAARGVMHHLIQYAADGSIILLCRRFRDRVLCVHQVFGRGPQEPVSYERGRPMPLFRGATSKVILAFLPRKELRPLFAANAPEIAKAGLGQTFEQFVAALKKLRRAGVAVTNAEVDPGRIGIAAPICNKDGTIQGSLTFVLPSGGADDRLIGRLIPLTIAGAGEIEAGMIDGDASGRPETAANADVKQARAGTLV